MCDWFFYWTCIIVIIEVIICHSDIWFYWNVALSPLFDIILCTCIDMRLDVSKGLTRGDLPCWDRAMIIWAHEDRPWDRKVMIMIWASGDRPVKFIWFMIVRWDRSHRHVEIVRVFIWTSRVPLYHELSMYFRGVSYTYGWESNWYSEAYHFIMSYCIASHVIIHSWWLCVLLVVGKYLIFDYLYLTNLILCIVDIVRAFCESCDC